LPIKNMSINP